MYIFCLQYFEFPALLTGHSQQGKSAGNSNEQYQNSYLIFPLAYFILLFWVHDLIQLWWVIARMLVGDFNAPSWYSWCCRAIDRGPFAKAQPSCKEEGFVSHFLNHCRRRGSRQIIFPKVLLLWCLHVKTKWKRSHRVFFTHFCPDWKTSSSWIIAHSQRKGLFLRRNFKL